MSAWLLVKRQHLLDRPGGVRGRVERADGADDWCIMHGYRRQACAGEPAEAPAGETDWPSRTRRRAASSASRPHGTTGPVCAAPWPWARLWHGRLIYVTESLACATILIQTVGGLDGDLVETSCRVEDEELTMMKISLRLKSMFVCLSVFELSWCCRTTAALT